VKRSLIEAAQQAATDLRCTPEETEELVHVARAGREAIDAKLYELQEAHRRAGGSVYGKRCGVLGALSLAARDAEMLEGDFRPETNESDADDAMAERSAEVQERKAFLAAKQAHADAIRHHDYGSPEELAARRELARLRASGGGRS
jgi:hypothetical protein